MAAAAQSYTIQLSSALSDAQVGEHYSKVLEPPIQVPYLARPRAQLEQLAFVNSFTNIDSKKYNNHKVNFAWRVPTEDPNQAGDFKPGEWNTLTIELDDGH